LKSFQFRRIDALLLLMAMIWGTNYSVVKSAFAELNPQAFNAMRLTIGSTVFLAIIVAMRLRPPPASGPMASISSVFFTPAAITSRDWLGLAALGVVGHFLYQYTFVAGLSQTSVANSALLLAATPVIIALITAAIGQERIAPLHWLGAALSMTGIYVVVGQGTGGGGASLRGDLLMAVAVCCWAIYTLGSRPLMTRHSPVGVTGLSMSIGTLLYVLAALPQIRAVDWSAVSRGTWLAIVYSALFALCIAYTIWYAAVREIGSAHTSIYSNLVPLVAMLSAVVFLGEPLGLRKILGAAAVLIGVGLTKVGGTRMAVPACE
jgi:drug/metabolite transporter (DMT)-like permease